MQRGGRASFVFQHAQFKFLFFKLTIGAHCQWHTHTHTLFKGLHTHLRQVIAPGTSMPLVALALPLALSVALAVTGRASIETAPPQTRPAGAHAGVGARA
jgi:hypothetical protein